MSFDRKVDELISPQGGCSGLVIAGLDGVIWHEGGTLKGRITTEELQEMVKAFSDPREFRSNGASIGRELFMYSGSQSARLTGAPQLHFRKDNVGALAIKLDRSVLLATYDGTDIPAALKAHSVPQPKEDLDDLCDY
ncbi:hypothetical protein BV898_14354 [Hypsibius exemplaris]|uniref:Profilin n=1 Tax=Hypsibius exemplaris TaxID=2072580 RepID=A0A9X6RJF2_HYPEX|nr:hypothetical protein BV898_14354 [Hypsibius exemplaris]